MTRDELVQAVTDTLEEFHLPSHAADVQLASQIVDALEAAVRAAAEPGHLDLSDGENRKARQGQGRAAFLAALTKGGTGCA
jgi:hypothetical protein